MIRYLLTIIVIILIRPIKLIIKNSFQFSGNAAVNLFKFSADLYIGFIAIAVLLLVEYFEEYTGLYGRIKLNMPRPVKWAVLSVILVLVLFLDWPWVVLSFLILTLAGWLWRGYLRRHSGVIAFAVLLMAADDDVDYEFALGLYLEALGQSLVSLGQNDDEHSLLKSYRQREEKRLRELVHEANNPLSVVQNYLHILQMRLQHDASASEQLDMISTELSR